MHGVFAFWGEGHHIHPLFMPVPRHQPLYLLAAGEIVPAAAAFDILFHKAGAEQFHRNGKPAPLTPGVDGIEPRPAASRQLADLLRLPSPTVITAPRGPVPLLPGSPVGREIRHECPAPDSDTKHHNTTLSRCCFMLADLWSSNPNKTHIAGIVTLPRSSFAPEDFKKDIFSNDWCPAHPAESNKHPNNIQKE